MRKQGIRCVPITSEIVYGYDFANNPRPKVIPEAKLLSMMFGSFFFAAGLFIFGWTAAKEGWIASFIGSAHRVGSLYHLPERLELPRRHFQSL